SKVPQLPTLSVLRKFSLYVFTAGVNSATHLKTPFPVIFSQNRRRRRFRKDPKPWDTKFRSERRFVELETRSPENAPVAGVPRLKTTTSTPRHRHVIATSATRHRHMSLRFCPIFSKFHFSPNTFQNFKFASIFSKFYFSPNTF
ncbi:hypothetical protein PIB30_086683, partial [Stylosanthes scabra]|nr:hypothetical protein [Stylosanthes scabra]